MSKSEQQFVAETEGTAFTMYAIMRSLGLPLSEYQERFQAELERMYPPVVSKETEE